MTESVERAQFGVMRAGNVRDLRKHCLMQNRGNAWKLKLRENAGMFIFSQSDGAYLGGNAMATICTLVARYGPFGRQESRAVVA